MNNIASGTDKNVIVAESVLKELVHLYGLYSCALESARKDNAETSRSSAWTWVSQQIVPQIGNAIFSRENDQVLFGIDIVYAVLVPISDLLVCRECLNPIAQTISTTLHQLNGYEYTYAHFSRLIKIFGIVSRLFCLSCAIELEESEKGKSSKNLELCWMECLRFILMFCKVFDRCRALEPEVESELRSEAVYYVSSVIQLLLSRLRLDNTADNVLLIIILFLSQSSDESGGTENKTLLACFENKPKLLIKASTACSRYFENPSSAVTVKTFFELSGEKYEPFSNESAQEVLSSLGREPV